MYTLLGGADTVCFPLQRDDAPGLPLKVIMNLLAMLRRTSRPLLLCYEYCRHRDSALFRM